VWGIVSNWVDIQGDDAPKGLDAFLITGRFHRAAHIAE
jgi:hypothetical protein